MTIATYRSRRHDRVERVESERRRARPCAKRCAAHAARREARRRAPNERRRGYAAARDETDAADGAARGGSGGARRRPTTRGRRRRACAGWRRAAAPVRHWPAPRCSGRRAASRAMPPRPTRAAPGIDWRQRQLNSASAIDSQHRCLPDRRRRLANAAAFIARA
jgi:hypothetical protein